MGFSSAMVLVAGGAAAEALVERRRRLLLLASRPLHVLCYDTRTDTDRGRRSPEPVSAKFYVTNETRRDAAWIADCEQWEDVSLALLSPAVQSLERNEGNDKE